MTLFFLLTKHLQNLSFELSPSPSLERRMPSPGQFILLLLLLCILCSSAQSSSSTIYEVLKEHGLPMGLLPKGVRDFSLDQNGRFEVHLDQPCNAKFENEIHYDRNVSGILSYGQIDSLSGISAQELFLWFPVKEIRVDIPSSGLIYFDVGVVSKQFSLSSFETPRDCIALHFSLSSFGNHIVEALAKSWSRELRSKGVYQQGDLAMAAL